ncbi:hypothetical protein LCGC14_1855010 [marine sediment metagenome]|uniref:Uncharacterized protein n=1 Tax=marine sediment metagenome TaxID=412755 RepID=A0A0F9GXK0_9ZZZZ
MVEISTFKQDEPIISPMKKNRMPMCRLITPNETILFGNKKLKNIGKEPTITCELTTEFSEQKVLEKIQSEPWYPDYNKMRENIIERCKVEGKLPIKQCESRDHISEHLLIGTDTDAFDTLNATHFRTRYIANLVDKIYPKTKDKGDGYTQRFHARNMHYRMLSENLAIPTFIKGEGWQISRYTGSEKQWNNLKEGLTEARNAGLIPFKLMRDARVPFEVKPSDFIVGKARKDVFQPNVNLDLQMNKNFDLDIEVPQIIFYSEKSEMVYVLDELSKKYANVGYFLGRGQISTS